MLRNIDFQNSASGNETPRLWLDCDCGRSPAEHMAWDEALAVTASAPLLRVYRWKAPAISFGCFVPFAEVSGRFSGPRMVRRWTGGGIVGHEPGELTYGLVLPRSHRCAGRNPVSSYTSIHFALLRFLAPYHPAIALESDNPMIPARGLCFQNPVRSDIMFHDIKIAGAAQRRTRSTLLHQGSIRLHRLPQPIPDYAAVAFGFALELFDDPPMVVDRPPDEARALVDRLVATRYDHDGWTRRC